MPEEVRNLCRLADISSKSLLLQVVRQDTPEKMTALIEKIASQGGATRQQLREAAAKPKAGRPKHYVFAFRPPTKAFNLKLSFNKSRASARRNHRRARSHHQGPPQEQVAATAPVRQPVASGARRVGRLRRLAGAGPRASRPSGDRSPRAHRRSQRRITQPRDRSRANSERGRANASARGEGRQASASDGRRIETADGAVRPAGRISVS